MSNIIARDDWKFFDDLANGYVKGDTAMMKKANAVLQAFWERPKRINKKLQAVAVSTDFERVTTNAFNVTQAFDNFDMLYEKAYQTVPIDPSRDYWEIYDVTDGLSFRLMQEGQRLEVEGLSGTVTLAYVDYYGGALGWTDRMIRFRKVPQMISLAQTFANNFWINKANNHYLLLATAAAGNITGFQGVAADGQQQRDIQTINTANFTLRDRLKDKGYGDTANVRIVGYANPFDKDRIGAAMRGVTNSRTGGTDLQVEYQIDWNFTFNSNIVSGSPILVFPGQKLQRVDVMQPTTFTAPQDPLTLNYLQSVWAIYGAVVADTDQVQQLTLGS